MGIQGGLDLHFWITRGMARRMGVNLTEAMQDGRLSHAELARMVERCRDCPGAQGCLDFLSERDGPAVPVPDWCCHTAVLSRLRAGR